jgi:hypothetical protein
VKEFYRATSTGLQVDTDRQRFPKAAILAGAGNLPELNSTQAGSYLYSVTIARGMLLH